jgi:hypothetical protein
MFGQVVELEGQIVMTLEKKLTASGNETCAANTTVRSTTEAAFPRQSLAGRVDPPCPHPYASLTPPVTCSICRRPRTRTRPLRTPRW